MWIYKITHEMTRVPPFIKDAPTYTVHVPKALKLPMDFH